MNGYLALKIPISNQNLLINAAKKAGKDFEEWAIDALNKQALLYMQ